MFNDIFAALPAWTGQLLWSLTVIAASYLVGHLLRSLIRRRIGMWAKRTKSEWDDALITEVSRRVPFWGLLLGVYISSGHWALTPQSADVLNKALFLAIAMSVTLFVSSIVAALARDYGQRLAGS